MRELKKLKIALCDISMSIFCQKAKASDKKRKILSNQEFNSILVYSTTALGDYMFNSPGLHAIRLRYPAAKITLIAHPKYTDLLTRYDDYNAVLYWNNKIGTLTQMVRKVRKCKPQLAILLHSHIPYDIFSAALVGCEFIVRDNYAKPVGKMSRWLTYGLDYFDEHIIARKMKLISALGCSMSTDNVDMVLPCEFQLQEKVSDIVRIGFQLGASSLVRCWPSEYYAQLAEMLVIANTNIEIVLIGSNVETHLSENLKQHVRSETVAKIKDFVGKTTLPQLLGIIGTMDILITGDTGPLHLAIAAKVRTLSLFMTENPRYSGPYQDIHRHHVIYIPMNDPRVTDRQQPLKAILPKNVYEHLNKIINF